MRWYLRYRRSDADVAELLAERGVRIDPSSIDARVQEFAPRYEAAARASRRAVGERWSVDETDVKVAGAWAYVYRALDEHGQVVDVSVSAERATADAAACFRRAIAATGVAPPGRTTNDAAAYPPVLAAVLPGVLHETGKPLQQPIERDHQHRKRRVRGMCGFKTLAGARVPCRAHVFLRNRGNGCYDLGATLAALARREVPATVAVWDARTADLLT